MKNYCLLLVGLIASVFLFVTCKKIAPAEPHCGLNNLEYIDGQCNCPKTKYRLNNQCITPNTDLYYGIGHNYGYFDTLTLSTSYSTQWQSYSVDVSGNATNKDGLTYGISSSCSYYPLPDGDSLHTSSSENYRIKGVNCNALIAAKFSKDKREVKVVFSWHKKETPWPGTLIDTTAMVLRNYTR
jgi:hypothetical protein